MAPNNPSEVLTVAEVAAELKVTEATVRRWINQDKLRSRRLAGGEFRILRGDINAMLGIEPEPEQPERPKRAVMTTASVLSTAERMSVE